MSESHCEKDKGHVPMTHDLVIFFSVCLKLSAQFK